MDIKTVPVSFKAGPDNDLEEGEFIVYPSTFTRTPDSYGDVVAKGAFAEGIAKRKADGVQLPGLFGHQMHDLDSWVAYAKEEGEDDHGWWVKGAFELDDPKAAKLYRLVKGGRIRELSFAYDVLEEGKVELKAGESANELRKLEVYEFSFVPIGANRDTSVVAIKSAAETLVDTIRLDGMKAGRVLSAKNEGALRSAYEAIGAVLDTLSSSTEDDEKASRSAAVKDDEPVTVKSDEPVSTRSATSRLLLDLALAEVDSI